jgi:hypothetical protein
MDIRGGLMTPTRHIRTPDNRLTTLCGIGSHVTLFETATELATCTPCLTAKWAEEKAAIAQAEHDAAVRAAHPGAAASMAAKRAARKAERK